MPGEHQKNMQNLIFILQIWSALPIQEFLPVLLGLIVFVNFSHLE